MDLHPDFERFRKAVNLQEADRVPLCETLWASVLWDDFLGREVTPDDVTSQVEFWEKFENFMAMGDMNLKYGVYPISL